MREGSIGPERQRILKGKEWAKENEDIIPIIDQAARMLSVRGASDFKYPQDEKLPKDSLEEGEEGPENFVEETADVGREKSIGVTAKYLSTQPIDLLDLWDEGLRDYLETRKDLAGKINNLKSAADLARAKTLKRPGRLSEEDAGKIVEAAMPVPKRIEDIAQFMDLAEGQGMKNWEKYFNILVKYNKEKKVIKNERKELDNLRRELVGTNNIAEARKIFEKFFDRQDSINIADFTLFFGQELGYS